MGKPCGNDQNAHILIVKNMSYGVKNTLTLGQIRTCLTTYYQQVMKMREKKDNK